VLHTVSQYVTQWRMLMNTILIRSVVIRPIGKLKSSVKWVTVWCTYMPIKHGVCRGHLAQFPRSEEGHNGGGVTIFMDRRGV